MKRRILSILSILLMLCMLTLSVYAVEEPDLERPGSVSIHMSYQGQTVPGGSLTLYQVAYVHLENDADYSFRCLESFAGCEELLADLTSAETAQALADFAAENDLSGTKTVIDENGDITFQNLSLGLYLLVQEDAAPGYEPARPFLVSVPGKENESLVYDVDASPKLQLEQAPTEPPTDPTDPTRPPDLPQTGQNNLPIPVLIVFGLGLCVLGVVLRAWDKKKHEA